MDVNTKTKSTTDASEQFREIAEKGAAQPKKAFDTVSAATGEAADVMKNCYSTAVKGRRITTTRSSNSLAPIPTPPSTLLIGCPA